MTLRTGHAVLLLSFLTKPPRLLLSLEGLRGLLVALPRAWLRQALCRLRSIVRELEVLVEPVTDLEHGFPTELPNF